jgi:hypothetical protein
MPLGGVSRALVWVGCKSLILKDSAPTICSLKTFNEQIVREFRENDGKVGGVFQNVGVLLLTTTGAKSGLSRLIALAYFTVDGSMVVAGSRGGAPKVPHGCTTCAPPRKCESRWAPSRSRPSPGKP